MAKKSSREKALYIHAYRRFYERFGIVLTKGMHHKICEKVRLGQGTFLKKSSLRVSVWEIDYEGQLYRLCYDKIRKAIVTVLPVKNTSKTPPPQ